MTQVTDPGMEGISLEKTPSKDPAGRDFLHNDPWGKAQPIVVSVVSRLVVLGLCMCMCVCVCMYVCLYMCLCVCLCVVKLLYVNMRGWMSACERECMRVFLCGHWS